MTVSRGSRLFASIVAALALAPSCGGGGGGAGGTAGAYLDHEEASDLVPVPDGTGKTDAFSAKFDPARVMSENFFVAWDAVTADQVQAFLESTPYGDRCFLADVTVGGKRAADAFVEVAKAYGLNPIVLLARTQVEKSLIGRTDRPKGDSLDFAFGCGCPDEQPCSEAYRGFDKQLACAAKTLRDRRLESMDGTGEWRAGHAGRTYDPKTVTPANHATAALYAYTPWVLTGEGGNWLVWNVTRKFALYFQAQGAIDLASPRLGDPWIGTPCVRHEECALAIDGDGGFCFPYQVEGATAPLGFCSLPCEGYCADLAGANPTFCADVVGSGACVAKSAQVNAFCGSIPGTRAVEADRFIGGSAAPALTASVCLP